MKSVNIKVPIYTTVYDTRQACVDWVVEATWQAAVQNLIEIYHSHMAITSQNIFFGMKQMRREMHSGKYEVL